MVHFDFYVPDISNTTALMLKHYLVLTLVHRLTLR